MSTSAQLKVELLLAAIDKVTSPLDAMKAASKRLNGELSNTTSELKGLERQQNLLSRFSQMKTESREKIKQMRDEQANIKGLVSKQKELTNTVTRYQSTLRDELSEQIRAKAVYQEKRGELFALQKSYKQGIVTHENYTARVKELKLEVSQAKQAQVEQNKTVKEAKAAIIPFEQELKKTEALLEKTKKSTATLSDGFKAQRDRIHELRKQLNEAGINTLKLSSEEKKLKNSIQAAKSAVEQKTAALKRQAEMEKNVARIQQGYDKKMGHSQALKSAGTQAVVTGGVMAAALSQPIKAYAEAEDAATQLKVSMMGAGGQVAKEFEQVNALATNLGNRLPGSTADFQNMMTALQRNGINAQSVLAGVGESAAYLAVSLKMPTEEAAVFAAKMKGALKATDSEMLAVMDSIQKGFNLGVTPDAMLAGYSKLTPALGTLRMQGDAAAKALAPLLVQANKMSMAGESAGNAFQKVFRLAVGTKNIEKGNAAAKANGVAPLNFTDAKGNFAGLENMYKELSKLKGLNDKAKQEILQNMFGNDTETLQALDVMINGGLDGYHEVQAKMQAQADLQTRVNEQLNTLANLWDAAKGTATNMLAAAGEAMGGDLKALANKMSEVSERTGNWMKQHPTMVKWIGRAVMGMIALSAAFGAVALAAGFLLSPFAKVWRAYKLFSEFKAGGGLLRLGARLTKLRGALSTAGGWFVKFGQTAWKGISWFGDKLGAALMRMGSLLGRFAGVLGRSIMSVGRGLMVAGRFMLANPMILAITAIAVAAYLIYKNWGRIVPFVKSLWARATAYTSAAWESIKSSVMNGVKAVINAVLSNPIVQFYIRVWSAVISYMTGLAGRFVSIGAEIVNGLWSGLKSKWDGVKSWLTNAAAALPEGVKKVLGINSPSRVFKLIGHDTMSGLHLGLSEKGGQAVHAVTQVARQMARMAMPPTLAMAGASGSEPHLSMARPRAAQRAGGSFSMGGVTIHVHAAPGMSADDVALAVERKLTALERAKINKAKSSYRDRD